MGISKLLNPLFGKAQKEQPTPGAAFLSDMYVEINTYAKLFGFNPGSDKFLTIPELGFQCYDVIVRLFKELDENNIIMLTTGPVWAFYSGVAAVALWDRDWEGTKRMGLMNAILSQRGFCELDEWVVEDVWGLKGTIQDGAHESGDRINLITTLSMSKASEYMNKHGIPQEQFMFKCMEMMYLYGISYQMHKIGLR